MNRLREDASIERSEMGSRHEQKKKALDEATIKIQSLIK